MTWTIHIAKRAEKQIAKAPAKSRGLLLAALEEMQGNPLRLVLFH
jgi:mRNA-degrading endonuclease RelE of RelBE toxin-antitoxin system